jgi:hypothetical protein
LRTETTLVTSNDLAVTRNGAPRALVRASESVRRMSVAVVVRIFALIVASDA